MNYGSTKVEREKKEICRNQDGGALLCLPYYQRQRQTLGAEEQDDGTIENGVVEQAGGYYGRKEGGE